MKNLRVVVLALAVAGAVVAGLGTAPKTSAKYPVAGTGQTKCYDAGKEIPCPAAGQAFHGQDAQQRGAPASYTLGAGGLTVYDNVTGLTWQRSPKTGGGMPATSDKLNWTQAQALPAKLNAAKFGGYGDWRLPSIKELYSLIRFNGTDPSGNMASETAGLQPFIDTKYFQFVYGDTKAGERVIDSQYASSTLDVNKSWRGFGKLFGVNFADGRIKGYDLKMPGGADKTFYVICVRGNPGYGKNDFHDNGDGTVTDGATGLIWQKGDSGTGLNWESALAWVEKQDRAKYLGHSDWRLPNAKELQSLVDYTRSPDTTDSAAIDPVFTATSIANEAGQPDYPYYWAATTHAMAPIVGRPPGREGMAGFPPPGPRGFTDPSAHGPMGLPPRPSGPGGAAVYVAFGRAMGYMAGGWHDVHGAGAQRSDPKNGDPKQFPQGRGPQGDSIRIYNYVRLVRN